MPDPVRAYETFIQNRNQETEVALWTEIYQFFHRRLRDKDLASDASVLAMNGISSYNPSLGTIEKWLANIAANLRRDDSRKDHDVQAEVFELESLLNIAAPTGIKLDLSVIADPQTRLLAKDVLAGYTIGEASERCGLTPDAGYKRLSRLGRNISMECLIR